MLPHDRQEPVPNLAQVYAIVVQPQHLPQLSCDQLSPSRHSQPLIDQGAANA